MKTQTHFRQIVVRSAWTLCFLFALGSWWLSAAQKQGGVILVPERKTPRPKAVKVAGNPVAKPTPVSLPEIANGSSITLAPALVLAPTAPPVLTLEADSLPPAPTAGKAPKTIAPVVETIRFKTALFDRRGKIKDEPEKTVKTFREPLDSDIWLELVEVPGGIFTMGAASGELGPESERPLHQVKVAQFWAGKYEITREQWRVVAQWPKVKIELKPDPSSFKDDDKLPVETVSWFEAQEFCARLERRTGRAYRLLTEAEWEYAARAGSSMPYAFGETITPAIVNYNGSHPYWKTQGIGEYREKTIPVGSLGRANAFGLFDMYGNVWEWCQDQWHTNYQGAPTDGSSWEGQEQAFNIVEQTLVVLRSQSVPDDLLTKLRRLKDYVFVGEEKILARLKTEIGEEQTLKFSGQILKLSHWDRPRVIRGCSWVDAAVNCRSAFRIDYGHPTLRRNDQGFRVAVSNVF